MENLSTAKLESIQYDKLTIQTKSGKIKIKTLDNAKLILNITLIALAAATLYGFLAFDYKNIDIMEASRQTIANLKTMFMEASLNHFSISHALNQVLITLGLGFLTTLIAAVISLFLGLFAASNLSNIHLVNIIKGFVAYIRAVPTVLWVLIFAVSAGLGSVAAIIGLSFHGIGYLVKAYSEAFEELDEGVIEALKASGANWWQIVFQAVLPSSAGYLMAWTFMRFEINFAVAVAMGAAAGAGGIGFDLFMAGGHYFDVREVGFITYMILFVAVALEAVSTRLKNKYL